MQKVVTQKRPTARKSAKRKPVIEALRPSVLKNLKAGAAPGGLTGSPDINACSCSCT